MDGDGRLGRRADPPRQPHPAPPPPGGGRFTVAPRVVPVRIAGRTEMVSLTTYNQLQSSAALARNMTNLARRFDGNWRPEPSMVGNVAGQIAANQSTAAQAVRFIHQTNPNTLPQASTLSIIAPRGNPAGFVAPRAGPKVRTLPTEREMQMMMAQLLAGARPLSKPHYNGMPYLRPDGVS